METLKVDINHINIYLNIPFIRIFQNVCLQ